MLRIYLTTSGIEGYHEGCSCCSSTEEASRADIQELIQSLTCQIEDLEKLKKLSEKYGGELLASWRSQFESLEYKRGQINAIELYNVNPKIQDTFYKNCFDNRVEIEREWAAAEKEYSRLPSHFRKYVEK